VRVVQALEFEHEHVLRNRSRRRCSKKRFYLAILGAIIALGAFVSRIDPKDQEGKLRCYDLGQELMKIFSKETGSTFCEDIIRFVLASEGGTQRYARGDSDEVSVGRQS